MKYCVGVDLGGTNIKTAIVDEAGIIVAEESRPTKLPRPSEEIGADIVESIRAALASAHLDVGDISGVGVGSPGVVDSKAGVVVYSNNLAMKDFALGAVIRGALGLPVVMGNDANVAALGEVFAGSAKGASSAVIITLGTGVGGGIVLNKQIWTGYGEAAGELGHMVVVRGGVRCTCGREGCLESYASATGLIRMTREAIQQYPDSLMRRTALADVDGRTAFNAMREGDTAAANVIEDYLNYLACGLANIVNALQPEVISLGGGIAKEGDALLLPLREKVYAEIFGGKGKKFTRIVLCTLGYKAGLIGAAVLAMQHAQK